MVCEVSQDGPLDGGEVGQDGLSVSFASSQLLEGDTPIYPAAQTSVNWAGQQPAEMQNPVLLQYVKIVQPIAKATVLRAPEFHKSFFSIKLHKKFQSWSKKWRLSSFIVKPNNSEQLLLRSVVWNFYSDVFLIP